MTNLSIRNSRFPSIFENVLPFARFDTFLDNVLDNIPAKRERNIVPATNVSATDEGYSLELACPGLEKSDLEIEVKNNIPELGPISSSHALIVSYTHKEDSENSFVCSSFKKTWTLPKDSDVEKVSASYDQGIFRVSVPRIAPIEPVTKKITVD
jgi:HSP20 family protein